MQKFEHLNNVILTIHTYMYMHNRGLHKRQHIECKKTHVCRVGTKNGEKKKGILFTFTGKHTNTIEWRGYTEDTWDKKWLYDDMER